MTPWYELSAGISSFVNSYGLAALFLVMLVKETGAPIPIPSDLLMFAAAVQSAAGQAVAWEAFTAIWLAMVLGAWVQYIMAREFGRPFLYRFGRYIGLTPPRLEAATAAVRRGGAVSVGVSLSTPGVRIAVIPAAGLARLPYHSFIPGLVFGSAVYLAWHFMIGYAAGSLASQVGELVNAPLITVIAAFFVVAFGSWLALRHRFPPHSHCPSDAAFECLHDWSHASCPVCVSLTAVHYFRRLRHA